MVVDSSATCLAWHNAIHLSLHPSLLACAQLEREGRWWWEDAAAKECGLHSGNIKKADGSTEERKAERDLWEAGSGVTALTKEQVGRHCSRVVATFLFGSRITRDMFFECIRKDEGSRGGLERGTRRGGTGRGTRACLVEYRVCRVVSTIRKLHS